MKKLNLLLIGCFVTILMYIPNWAYSERNVGTTTEIQIRDFTQPGGKGTVTPRSVMPVESSAVAWYDSETAMLEVLFNNEVGQVAILVTDAMNRTVASADCNTALTDIAYLSFAAAPGECYTIRIVGNDYEGVGYLMMPTME